MLVEFLFYFFVDNNVNYVWWFLIYLRDIMIIDKYYLEVVREFFKGYVVVYNFCKEFL